MGWVCAVLLATTVMLTAPATAMATGSTGRVPVPFVPTSTSWTDNNTGFVLGFTPCGSEQCPALVQTLDGGTNWLTLSVPEIRLTSDDRVRVHFADGRDGLITDGEKVYATHSGGEFWRQVELPDAGQSATIGALASNDSAFYAIVSDEATTRLFSTPLRLDQWAPVPGIELKGAGGGGSVAARGGTAHVVLNLVHQSTGYWVTRDGRTWRAGESPCATNAVGRLSLAGDQTVFALCSYDPGWGTMSKDLRASTSGGPFANVSSAPVAGITTDFAAASPSTVAVAAVGRGAALLHRGTEGATVWDTPFVTEEPPFRDLDFTGEQVGVMVWGGPMSGVAKVYRTHDAGTTWTPLTFGDKR